MTMENNRENQLKHIQLTIEQAKASVERMKTMHRLLENDDFKKIIDQGYFVEEAARLVGARMDSNMQGEEEQKHVMRLIDGVGGLRQYLQQIERWGLMAERALHDHEETREELLREQLEEAQTGAQA